MTTPRRRRRRARPWAARLLLLGALEGLFAMHGLGGHGTAMSEDAMAAMSTTAPATTASPGHHAAGEAVADGSAGSAVLVAVSAAVLSAADPLGGTLLDHASMVMCLAILLLAAALALARAAPALAPAAHLRPAASVLPRRTRSSDPPDLSRLCVLRC
ncbi:hypothetical protein SAMN04488570_3057 [Nocardioides scoriae]|uniref:Uncharacterized protein n=1 Tax=Nocardioides scoriae TaxID=642780 RepID=A0A1H1W6U0_9ACTN|nr:DUF6153 family protein [Nocardioides scoriae]SDS92765.1 hypothetical protein SAMN04488570_3057 [Nocardioides scoriae]